MAIYRHVVSGSLPGEIWSFTMHTDSSLGVDAAHTAWTSEITDFWTSGDPALQFLMAPEVVVTQTSTALLSGTTGEQVTRRISAVSIPGTSTSNMLPYQVSVAVSLRTELATRSGRGRFYLPPLVTANVTDGRLAATAQAVLADEAQSFLQGLTTSGLTPVIYHRSTNSSTEITSIDVGDVFDTQRRRRGDLIEVRESRPV